MSVRGAETPSSAGRSLKEQFLWALLLAALVALTIGPLDALLNFLATPLGDRLPDPTRVAITLGAGLILTLFCFGVLFAAFVSLSLVCRLNRWPYRRITLVLAVCPFAVLLKSSIGNFGLAGFGGVFARVVLGRASARRPTDGLAGPPGWSGVESRGGLQCPHLGVHPRRSDHLLSAWTGDYLAGAGLDRSVWRCCCGGPRFPDRARAKPRIPEDRGVRRRPT
jgi:hypothetical protein